MVFLHLGYENIVCSDYLGDAQGQFLSIIEMKLPHVRDIW